MKSLTDIRAAIGPICSIAALAFALSAALKLLGFFSIRYGVIELCAVAIALAHVR